MRKSWRLTYQLWCHPKSPQHHNTLHLHTPFRKQIDIYTHPLKKQIGYRLPHLWPMTWVDLDYITFGSCDIQVTLYLLIWLWWLNLAAWHKVATSSLPHQSLTSNGRLTCGKEEKHFFLRIQTNILKLILGRIKLETLRGAHCKVKADTTRPT